MATGGHSPPLDFAAIVKKGDPERANLPKPEISSYKGEPAIKFPQPLIDHLAKPYRYALIGKFSQGRPSMEAIRRFMSDLNFAEKFTMGLLDQKHVIFNFTGKGDYIRFFSKGIWRVTNIPMRVLKWTPGFRAGLESSVVPIWLSLPRLPAHLLDPESLSAIVSSFGQPLRVDDATLDLRSPSIARIQAEIDILKPIPKRVWIQQGEAIGYWQTIDVDEVLPHYCSYCFHIGHEEQFCLIKYPAKHKTYKGQRSSKDRGKQLGEKRSIKLVPQYRILKKPEVTTEVDKQHHRREEKGPMLDDGQCFQPIIEQTYKATSLVNKADVVAESSNANQMIVMAEKSIALNALSTNNSFAVLTNLEADPKDSSQDGLKNMSLNLCVQQESPSSGICVKAAPVVPQIDEAHDSISDKSLDLNMQGTFKADPYLVDKPIIYDKNSTELAKRRFLENMGKSSDSESNKDRARKEQAENYDEQEEDSTDNGFITQDDSAEEDTYYGEEPSFISWSKSKNKKNRDRALNSTSVNPSRFSVRQKKPTVRFSP